MASRAKRGMATITDVAREAGVSTATAARVLGGYGSASRSARERVSAAAEALGYRANVVARSMITGTTRTIGVVLADIENPFFHRALRGITDTARKSGYQVIVANTDEDLDTEHSAVTMLTERRVDGLVVCPADAADRTHLAAVIDSGTPIVLLDRRVSGLAADTVGIDNRDAARQATNYLLATGHTRIAILTGAFGDMAVKLKRPTMKGVERMAATTVGPRAAGYRDALLAAGIEPRTEYVVANGFRREDAFRGTEELLKLDEPPTAILATDSILSLGALQAFRDLGVRHPEDVSLIGFDDSEWAEVLTPPLTVVAQPVYEIGARSAELLLDRIGGHDARPKHYKLKTTIIERGSVVPSGT